MLKCKHISLYNQVKILIYWDKVNVYLNNYEVTVGF